MPYQVRMKQFRAATLHGNGEYQDRSDAETSDFDDNSLVTLLAIARTAVVRAYCPASTANCGCAPAVHTKSTSAPEI